MEASQYEKKHFKPGVHEDEHAPRPRNEAEIQREASCSSSSTSDSEDDFFQLDPSELNKSMAETGEMPSNSSVSQHGENTQLAFKAATQDEERKVTGDENRLAVLTESGQVTMGTPSSQHVPPGSESENSSTLGVKQPPPIQVMGTYDVPDPNRIPFSIFRTKSTAPMEWSVTSNESLFSICMGRSGDLGTMYNSHLDVTPPISPLPNAGAGQDLEPPGPADTANAEAMKEVLRAAREENADKGKPTNEDVRDSASPASDSSFGSYRSFAFPILTGEGKAGSIKVESVPEPAPKQQEEQPHPQTGSPKPASVAAGSRWFPCFSCCSFCC